MIPRWRLRVQPPRRRPEPKKGKKKGRFAAMLDEDAVETEYETSIRGAPPARTRPRRNVSPRIPSPRDGAGDGARRGGFLRGDRGGGRRRRTRRFVVAARVAADEKRSRLGTRISVPSRNASRRRARRRRRRPTRPHDLSKGTEPTPECGAGARRVPSLARALARRHRRHHARARLRLLPRPNRNPSSRTRLTSKSRRMPRTPSRRRRRRDDSPPCSTRRGWRRSTRRASAARVRANASHRRRRGAPRRWTAARAAAAAEAAFAEADANLELSRTRTAGRVRC